MRYGLVFSIVLHLAIIVIALVGLPFFKSSELMEEQPLVVELVEMGERTAAPPAAPAPPKEEPKPEPPQPKQEPPKPEPPKQAPPPPPEPEPAPPPPAPEPEPAPPPPPKVETPPEPEPAPEPEPEPEVAKVAPPPKKPTPPKKPEPPKKEEPKVAEKKPEPKKEPPKKQEEDPFASLVKNVEKFRDKKAPSEAAPQQAAPARPAPGPQVRNAPFAERATMTERDHIRRQIEQKWNIDPGKPGLEDMVVVLNVQIDPAGNVVDVRIAPESWPRYSTDSSYRSIAEAAMRAATMASPLEYPRQKYDIFKNMQLVFSPQSRL